MDGEELSEQTIQKGWIDGGVDFVIATYSGSADGMFQFMHINWDFGQDITSCSEVWSANKMFQHSPGFNSDIGWWETVSLNVVDNMFHGADSFLQDLSWWCTPDVMDPWDVFLGCPMRDHSELQPDWGNCPTPPPWHFHIGGVFHITGRTRSIAPNSSMAPGFIAAYDMDGNLLGEYDRLDESVDYVALYSSDCKKAFQFYPGEFKFGEHTRFDFVKDMNAMFEGTSFFNEDMSSFDTSNVETMENCFKNATAFEQDLSKNCWGSCATPEANWCKGSGIEGQTDKYPKWGVPC